AFEEDGVDRSLAPRREVFRQMPGARSEEKARARVVEAINVREMRLAFLPQYFLATGFEVFLRTGKARGRLGVFLVQLLLQPPVQIAEPAERRLFLVVAFRVPVGTGAHVLLFYLLELLSFLDRFLVQLRHVRELPRFVWLRQAELNPRDDVIRFSLK